MLYTEPQLFRCNGMPQFAQFLGALLEEPFSAHVNQECRQLMPIYGAASALLRPIAEGDLEHKVLTQGGIAKTHRMISTAYGSLMYNMPLILEEGFAGLEPNGYERSYTPLLNAMKRAGLDKVTSVAYLEPDGGSRKTNRMFGVGRFGFITIKYEDDSDFAKPLVFPYMSAPRDIMRREGAEQLLKDSARVAFWQNHDWFHNITAGAINKAITGTSPDSPMQQYGQELMSHAYHTNSFRNQGEISFGYFGSDLEKWAMRIQREISAVLMRPAENPVYDDIQRYLKTFSETGLAGDKVVMNDPQLTSAEYTARVLAGSLVRAVPFYHRDTQRTLRRCISACDSAGHPEARESLQTAFEKIYNGKWAKQVIFGGGGYYADPQIYSTHINDMSASAVAIAFDEAKDSLQEYAKRKRAARDTAPDLKSAFMAAAAYNDNFGQAAPAPRLG